MRGEMAISAVAISAYAASAAVASALHQLPLEMRLVVHRTPAFGAVEVPRPRRTALRLEEGRRRRKKGGGGGGGEGWIGGGVKKQEELRSTTPLGNATSAGTTTAGTTTTTAEATTTTTTLFAPGFFLANSMTKLSMAKALPASMSDESSVSSASASAGKIDFQAHRSSLPIRKSRLLKSR